MPNLEPPQSVEQALYQAVTHHQAGQLQDAERLYRVILQAQPNQADANHNMGVLAVQAKQPVAGLPYFKAALEADPNQGQYWLSYIDALMQAGQTDAARLMLEQGRQHGLQGEAVEAMMARLEKTSGSEPDPLEINTLVSLFAGGRYQEAATLAQTLTVRFPLHGFGWNMLGVVLAQMGQNTDALVPMQKAAALSPDDADVHYNLGVIFQELSILSEAEASFRRALQIKADFVEAHSSLGATLQNMGRLDEAEASYRRALQIKPGFTGVHNNLGCVLNDLGRLDEAEASYRQALEIEPDSAEVHNNLGLTLQNMARLDEAEACYRRALQIKPGYAEAHNNLGITLKNLGRLGEAEASYRQALEIRPDYAGALSNLGLTLQNMVRLDEAEACLRRALGIKPDYAEAHNNLGITLCDMGRLGEAEASYRRALQIKPDYADAQLNLSLVLLTLGQFQQGWQGYEMRWKQKEAKCLSETFYPCWLGKEDIAGKKLLVQFEQGLGDAIQMLRYVPLLEQKNVECWIQVPDSLHRLVARSFPCAKIIGQHTCPKGLDYRIPVMSLPLAMRTFSEQTIPSDTPYLIADNDRVSFWQKKLISTRSKTVGLVWRGNPNQKNNHNRSASLTDLLPLIATRESIQFVTLQKGLTDAERDALNDYDNVRILDAELTDLDETAAVMCNMDIVISVCTGPAHLSGALGTPTWILLCFGADWRWMVDCADSPWYPTARLYRQKSIGNWTGVVADAKASLAEL